MSLYGPYNEILDPKVFEEQVALIDKQLKLKFVAMYMKMASECIRPMSYCERLQVGSLVCTPQNEILIGYNGTPSGHENCCEIPGRDETKPSTLHSESNTMAKANRSTLTLINATLYVTHMPCMDCAKSIIQSGIRRVFFMTPYRSNAGLELLTQPESKVQVIQLGEDYSIKKIYSFYESLLDIGDEFVLEYTKKEISSLQENVAFLEKEVNDLKETLLEFVKEQKNNKPFDIHALSRR